MTPATDLINHDAPIVSTSDVKVLFGCPTCGVASQRTEHYVFDIRFVPMVCENPACETTYWRLRKDDPEGFWTRIQAAFRGTD
jgi:hypothetical protein